MVEIIACGFSLTNPVSSDTVDLPNLSYGSLTDQQKTEKNLCIYGGLKKSFLMTKFLSLAEEKHEKIMFWRTY